MDKETADKIIKGYMRENEPLLRFISDIIARLQEDQDWQRLSIFSAGLASVSLFVQTLLPDEYRPEGDKFVRFEDKDKTIH